MLKYSVLNNMLRRMKKYAEVFSKISACFRENLYKKIKKHRDVFREISCILFLNCPIYVKNLQSFSLLCLRKSYLCHQNFFPEDL